MRSMAGVLQQIVLVATFLQNRLSCSTNKMVGLNSATIPLSAYGNNID
jgi:hypothetical protein